LTAKLGDSNSTAKQFHSTSLVKIKDYILASPLYIFCERQDDFLHFCWQIYSLL